MRKGLGFTRRAFAILVVFALLTVSYATSLRIYFTQQNEIAQHEQSIRQRTTQITSIEDELQRWKDPNYVRAQARTRLGWVVPGETGYVVVDGQGKPITGSGQIAQNSDAGRNQMTWWQKLWDSITSADRPTKSPTNTTPIGTPTASPTR